MKKRGEYEGMYDSDEDEVCCFTRDMDHPYTRTLTPKTSLQRRRRRRRSKRTRPPMEIGHPDRPSVQLQTVEPNRRDVNDPSHWNKRQMRLLGLARPTLLKEPLQPRRVARRAHTRRRRVAVNRPRMGRREVDLPAGLSEEVVLSLLEAAVPLGVPVLHHRKVTKHPDLSPSRTAVARRAVRRTRSESKRPSLPRRLCRESAHPFPMRLRQTTLPGQMSNALHRPARLSKSERHRPWPTKRRPMTPERRRSRMGLTLLRRRRPHRTWPTLRV